jgi:Fe-S-cluster-containing dehydrogenase component
VTPARSATSQVDVERQLCTACRACELACHFHHSGGFGTERSSILVTLDPDSGSVQIAVDASCDGCVGESPSLCVKACVPGALRSIG